MGDSPDPQVDPAMLELFQAEMDTHVPALNAGLLALEKGQLDSSAIEAMMRAAHSIKGAARIVGIAPAVRLAHVMEDCFTATKEGRMTLSSEAVDVLLQGVDTLQRICAPREASTVSEGSLQQLIDRLSLLQSGTMPGPPGPASSAELGRPLEATIDPGMHTIIVPAESDENSLDKLRQDLLGNLAAPTRRLHLDFSQVANLKAAGLTLLASFAQEAAMAQPPVIIESRRVSPAVRTVLRMAGLDTSFGLTS